MSDIHQSIHADSPDMQKASAMPPTNSLEYMYAKKIPKIFDANYYASTRLKFVHRSLARSLAEFVRLGYIKNDK
jgi:hypothetical protein